MYCLQVHILSWLVLVGQGAKVYVTNSELIARNHACIRDDEELHPCINFKNLASELLLNSFQDISIIFINDNYSVYKNVSLNFASLSVVRLGSWKNRNQVNIYCIGDLSLVYTNVRIISISYVEFYDCGRAAPVITMSDVQLCAQISNTKFIKSRLSFIKTLGFVNRLNVFTCLFDESVNDFGVDINSYANSSISFMNTTFTNSMAGSLRISYYDRVTLPISEASIQIWNCIFTNNMAMNSTNGAAITVDSEANLIVRKCSFVNNSIGSAILFDKGCCNSLIIINTIFTNNKATSGGALTVKNLKHIRISNSKFVGNFASGEGGAIKIEGTIHQQCLSNVSIQNCSFLHNYARNGGGLYSKLNHTCGNNINITYTEFVCNTAEEKGGTLAVDIIPLPGKPSPWRFFQPRKPEYTLFISQSTFLNNTASKGGALNLEGVNVIICDSRFRFNMATILKNVSHGNGGGAIAISQKFPSSFLVKNCFFFDNIAANGGVILSRKNSPNIEMSINNSKFTRNIATNNGGALFLDSTTCLFHKNVFSGNKAKEGGAIYLSAATGDVLQNNFIENKACTGGAFYLKASYMTIYDIYILTNEAKIKVSLLEVPQNIDGLSHTLYNNLKSGKGGGIYVEDTKRDCNVNSCHLTWNNHSNIKSINNSAQSGSILYGGMISRCSQIVSIKGIASLLNSATLNKMSNDAISSDAIEFCFFDNHIPVCELRAINKTVFVGQSFEVQVVCLDQMMQEQQCSVKSEYFKTTKINLKRGENSRTIEGDEKLVFHAYSYQEQFGILVMTSDILCSENTLKVHVTIEQCPFGFEKIADRCQCDHRLQEQFVTMKCNIDEILIIMEENGWFGYDDQYLRIHNGCPLNYCSQRENISGSSYQDAGCDNNRGGILCGRCVADYSVVLGSWKCRKCSHLSRYNFIWLTVVIALAGVVLVVFLFLVKVTVSSGTINGLIFYANIMSFSGLLDYQNCSLHPILRVFMSWINLDFGIEVCFYQGMDVYQKTWLQFIFPFYIWFLVGVIILFCHYSSTVMKLMGMRNIEVLATLFLLSYPKLLKTIVTSLSSTDIMVASADNVSDSLVSQKIWLYDGHINYLSPKHLPLFIVALIFLVFLFLPYTLVLLFGQCLIYVPRRRGLMWIHNQAINSILDAYNAPYMKNCRYWTGLGLLIRCCLYTTFGVSYKYSVHSNLFWMIIAVGLLFLVRVCHSSSVYRKKLVDFLEIFFLANLGAVAVLLYRGNKFCEVLTVSASLSFAVFIGISVCHIYFETKRHFSPCNHFARKLKSHISSKNSSAKSRDELVITGKPEHHSTTYMELRESLIDN